MIRLKDLLKTKGLKVLSSGSKLLDYQALLVGGYPCGKIVEIFGKESAGKSTLVLSTILEAQKENMKVYLIDSEGSFDARRAERMGIDLGEVWLLDEAETIQDGFNVLLSLMDKEKEGLFIWDSIAASPTRAEVEEGQVGDTAIAEKARALSLALRLVTSKLTNSDWVLIFINQVREKIGTFGFGDKYTTPGGHALKFHASLRLRMAQVKKEADGIWTRVTVAKSRVGVPYRQVDLFLSYETGLDDYKSCVRWAKALKLIDKKKLPSEKEILELVKTPVLSLPGMEMDDEAE